jgi:hypothetical protein
VAQGATFNEIKGGGRIWVGRSPLAEKGFGCVYRWAKG